MHKLDRATLYTMVALVALPVLGLGAWLLTRAHERAQCDPDLVRAAYKIDRRWAEQREIAGSTPRMALAGAAAELQKIRGELEELKPTPCLAKAREARLTEMAETIASLLAFVGSDDSSSTAHLTASYQARDVADASVSEVRRRIFPEEVAEEERKEWNKAEEARKAAAALAAEEQRKAAIEKARQEAEEQTSAAENAAFNRQLAEKSAAEAAAKQEAERDAARRAAAVAELKVLGPDVLEITNFERRPEVTKFNLNRPTFLATGTLVNHGSKPGIGVVVVSLLYNDVEIDQVAERLIIPAGGREPWTERVSGRPMAGDEKWSVKAVIGQNPALYRTARSRVARIEVAPSARPVERPAPPPQVAERPVQRQEPEPAGPEPHAEISALYSEAEVTPLGDQMLVTGKLFNTGAVAGRATAVVTLLRDGKPQDSARIPVSVPAKGQASWSHKFTWHSSQGSWTATVNVEP